ncbi:MAG: hypothetical protein KAU17_04910 [Spirochaetales bacterium]|nr:hypothetical protein [Spirochaetales bacterium]
MEIRIKHERFEGQRLVVKTANFIHGPRLLLNDQILKAKRGKYIVRDNIGNKLLLRLKYNLVDPIPKLEIEGEDIELAPPLKWYQYVLIGLPLVLVAIGGAVGFFIGVITAYANVFISRSSKNTLMKSLLTLGTSIAAIIGFFILATIIAPLMN